MEMCPAEVNRNEVLFASGLDDIGVQYIISATEERSVENFDTFRTRQHFAAETSRGISVREAFLAE